MYLPNEIWSKIWMYSAIVDSNRKQLLSSIRKYQYKIQLEKIYLDQWGEDYYDWLNNDIYGWMNHNEATLNSITHRMKHIFKRSFDTDINNVDDIDVFENGRSSKILWNVYLNGLTEDEFYNFYRSIIDIDGVRSLLEHIHS